MKCNILTVNRKHCIYSAIFKHIHTRVFVCGCVFVCFVCVRVRTYIQTRKHTHANVGTYARTHKQTHTRPH